jgi:5'(3')-deoxyribonucleotidase
VFGYRLARSILSYPSLIFVGVDIDGVLGEQVPPVLQRMKSKGKAANATKENIIDWNFQLDDTDISKEIEEALLDPTFVLEMPVVQGSTSAMQQIYKKYHIVIVTSRPIDTEKETKDWLKKNFKFHEFINTRECGKNSLGLDLLIDDNLDNVKAFASSGGCALLFSQPWNLKTDDKDLENLIRARKTVRCENWDEILKSITNIEKKLRR